jgi:homoserine kinase
MWTEEPVSFVEGPVGVRVPATSANLGPGFDVLGLALSLYDDVVAEVLSPEVGDPEITVEGEGAGEVPLDDTHLVHRAMAAAFQAMGVTPPRLRLLCRNEVPHGRGLGSSSAAIVSGLWAARALVAGGPERWSDHALFELAARIEGHPDNVAPAVFGGLTLAYEADAQYHVVRLDVRPDVEPVVLVPDHPMETEVARGLLPTAVSHADAVFSSARVALLVAALTGDVDSVGLDVLVAASEDRLHQPYRTEAMPDTMAAVADLRAAGVPAMLSGAGPSVLVLAGPGQVDVVAAHVPDGWRLRTLGVDAAGVRDHADTTV